MAPRSKKNGRVQVVQQSRKFELYQVTSDELDNVGNMNMLCQVFLSGVSIAAGALTAAAVELLTNKQSSMAIQVIFWASLVLTVVLGVAFGAAFKMLKSGKNKISKK